MKIKLILIVWFVTSCNNNTGKETSIDSSNDSKVSISGIGLAYPDSINVLRRIGGRIEIKDWKLFIDNIRDTNFEYTYIKGQLFKKSFFLPENGNRLIQIYYPDDPLLISNAELIFSINLLDNSIASEEIIIGSKKTVTIESVTSLRDFVRFTDSFNNPVSFPLIISPDSSFKLKIIASPTSVNYRESDIISIVTTERKLSYKIFSDLYVYHINGRTVETLKSIELSRTKDKYLILPRMGSVTDAVIVSKEGREFNYPINETTKIDLQKFKADTYQLLISSCHTGGKIELIVTE